MFRNPRRHGCQGPKGAVDFGGEVAGAGLGAAQGARRQPQPQDQHHGERPRRRPRPHLVASPRLAPPGSSEGETAGKGGGGRERRNVIG